MRFVFSGLPGKTTQARPKLLRVAMAVFLQCLYQIACAADDKMTFTYKHDVFEGLKQEFWLIYADGPIVTGTAKKFVSLVQSNQVPAGAAVILNSPGGLVSEALELGRAIRRAGFDTDVGMQGDPSGRGSVCYSACTLAFLGGVNRTVQQAASFGVHRFSTDVKLSSKEALDIGQIQMSEITEYAAYMGVSPDFVIEMVKSSSSSINVLTQEKLTSLGVITHRWATTWEIKADSGVFYLLGTTHASDGVDKMIVTCDRKRLAATMLFNTSGEYMDGALRYTRTYRWSFDGQEVEIPKQDIVEPVTRTGDEYVGTTIRLTTETLQRLSTTSKLGFMMVPNSKIIFQGWTSDFQSGKQKFFEFINTCH